MADELEDLIDSDEIHRAMQEQEVIEGMLELAEEAAAFWRSIAPVGDASDPHAGQYRDSIEVQQIEKKVYVVTEDPIANLIEYGSVHNPEYACRARTEDQFQGQVTAVPPKGRSRRRKS
jgi:hypothetical protein